jgi:uncharacterized protein YdcH (DUF465 family)
MIRFSPASPTTLEEDFPMSKHSEAVKEYLLKENEEFKRLARKHRELDNRITSLSSRFLLSDEEKFEEASLKKKKLALKDKMADFVRRYEMEQSRGVRPAPA